MNKISEARKAKGWTQQDLADRIGVTQQAIQRYEKGTRDLKASVLRDLSKALGVTVAYLLGMTDVPDKEPGSSGTADVPLYGSVAAGNPIDMENADELYPIPAAVHNRWPDAFLLRVKGESMNRILPNGCYALVTPCSFIDRDGQPYALSVNGLAATIKRVRKLDDGYELCPDSTDASYLPHVLSISDAGNETLSVIGRVVWHCLPYTWTY